MSKPGIAQTALLAAALFVAGDAEGQVNEPPVDRTPSSEAAPASPETQEANLINECNLTLDSLEREITFLERALVNLQVARWNTMGISPDTASSDMDIALVEATTYVLPEAPLIESSLSDELLACVENIVTQREYFLRLVATWHEMRTDVSNSSSNSHDNLVSALAEFLPEDRSLAVTEEFRRRMQRIIALISRAPDEVESRIVQSDDEIEINGIDLRGFTVLQQDEVPSLPFTAALRLGFENGNYYEANGLPQMIEDCHAVKNELEEMLLAARAYVVAMHTYRDRARDLSSGSERWDSPAPFRSSAFGYELEIPYTNPDDEVDRIATERLARMIEEYPDIETDEGFRAAPADVRHAYRRDLQLSRLSERNEERAQQLMEESARERREFQESDPDAYELDRCTTEATGTAIDIARLRQYAFGIRADIAGISAPAQLEALNAAIVNSGLRLDADPRDLVSRFLSTVRQEVSELPPNSID